MNNSLAKTSRAIVVRMITIPCSRHPFGNYSPMDLVVNVVPAAIIAAGIILLCGGFNLKGIQYDL